MLTPETALPALSLAILIDAVVGDPKWVYDRMPHPIVLVGKLIGWIDRFFNRETFPGYLRKLLGMLCVIFLLSCAVRLGLWIEELLKPLTYGWLIEAVLMAILIAQNSLYKHVAEVANTLGRNLEEGRQAVSMIVGRDPTTLDDAGVARAAIESTAENFSDGVAAPLLFAAIFGLPGLLAYKFVNTADSMIGHLTDRHRDFGWAAARLDDVLNYVPARLSGLLIVFAAPFISGSGVRTAWHIMARDAGDHRSVNAGYPEAAMAGLLGLRLGGPRRYGDEMIDDVWLGDGTENASMPDIHRALKVMAIACIYLFLLIGIGAAIDIWG